MIWNGNGGMATIPGFNQIQFESFCRFITKGLREEFEKFPKEKIEDINQNLEFLLFVKRYQLVEPLIKERDTIYKSLTYSVRLYVPAGLTRKTSIKMQKQTVFIGNIPIKKGVSISRRINSIPFDRYGYALQALEPAEIPIRQIEAGRWAIQRYLRRRGKLWVLPQKPDTITTTESEWDHSDKKNPRLIISKYSVYVISTGDILYEISGVSETIARRALKLAANIMPIQTQFFYILTYGVN
jgi:ribosomal protein L16